MILGINAEFVIDIPANSIHELKLEFQSVWLTIGNKKFLRAGYPVEEMFEAVDEKYSIRHVFYVLSGFVFIFDFRLSIFFFLPLKPHNTMFDQFHPLQRETKQPLRLPVSAVNVFTFDFRLSIFDFLYTDTLKSLNASFKLVFKSVLGLRCPIINAQPT